MDEAEKLVLELPLSMGSSQNLCVYQFEGAFYWVIKSDTFKTFDEATENAADELSSFVHELED